MKKNKIVIASIFIVIVIVIVTILNYKQKFY